jgi:CRP/FNR family transcriptional regulator
MLIDEIKDIFSPYFHEINFPRGEMLWHEGDSDGMMILIISGSVKIFRIMPDGNSVTFFILQSGDLFGFLPMVDGGPYPVSAETLEDLSALAITHLEFRNILKKNPSMALPVMQYLSNHLRNAFDIIARRSSKDALPLVASAFLNLYNNGTDSNNIITLPVSSREYALLIGLTPESFSRKITELVRLNVIQRLDINTFRIIDKEKLKDISFPINFL